MKITYSTWEGNMPLNKDGVDISKYANPDFSCDKMTEIRIGLENNINVDKYLKADAHQLKYIIQGLIDGYDVSVYDDYNRYNGYQMQGAYNNIRNRRNPNEYLVGDMFMASKIKEQIALYHIAKKYDLISTHPEYYATTEQYKIEQLQQFIDNIPNLKTKDVYFIEICRGYARGISKGIIASGSIYEAIYFYTKEEAQKIAVNNFPNMQVKVVKKTIVKLDDVYNLWADITGNGYKNWMPYPDMDNDVYKAILKEQNITIIK